MQPKSKRSLRKVGARSQAVAVIIALLLSHHASSAWASIRYVKSDATGTSTGLTWADAYTDLQAALAAAQAGDEIWVAAGTYKPASDLDRSKSFNMVDGVGLYGGFTGGESSRAQRNWAANPTILSGDIGTSGSLSDNAYSVVVGASGATLDGFTITDANADGAPASMQSGGIVNISVSSTVANCSFVRNNSPGIYTNNGSLNVSDCMFIGNQGGIYNQNCAANVTSCNFMENIARNGGGLVSYGGSTTVTQCAFFGNRAQDGGGIYGQECALDIIDCIFSRNSSTEMGGGMKNWMGAANLIRCSFNANASGSGGGIYNGRNSFADSGSLTACDCEFTSNTASSGGGIFNDESLMRLGGCVFNCNTASDSGGGVVPGGNRVEVVNCVFTGNLATLGGAISGYYYGLSCDLTNCTFFGNEAAQGCAVACFDTGEATATNCIFWDNCTSAEHTETDLDVNGMIAFFACDIRVLQENDGEWDPRLGTDGGGNFAARPRFVNPAYPAGPDSIWRTADDGFRLSEGSPCLAAGTLVGVPAKDILGQAKSGRPDVGAYSGIANGAAPPPLGPVVRYVRPDATGANNGTSWRDAFVDLQVALGASDLGDEIWVASGTYRPTRGVNPIASFVLATGVAMFGGFAGVETDRSARNWDLNPSIFSGDIGLSGIPNDNCYHVVIGSRLAGLDGFTIANGNSIDPNSDSRGAGMLNVGVSPTVANCKFIGNASELGAGMFNEESSPLVVNCDFTSNTGTKEFYSDQSGGGGMFNSNSAPRVIDCSFSGNSAVNPFIGGYYNYFPSNGGAIGNANGSSPRISNCVFSGNFSDAGGAIYNETDSTVTLTDCVLILNLGTAGGGMLSTASHVTATRCSFIENSAIDEGGGMNNATGTIVTTFDCTFTSNTAGRGAGMFNYQNGTPTINGCIFSNNRTIWASGGGLDNQDCSPLVTSCVFSGNFALQNGGGMNLENASATVTNCTFTSNSAHREGGGIFLVGGTPSIANSILWDDHATTAPEFFCDGGLSTFAHSDIQGSMAGGAAWKAILGTDDGGNIDADPLFMVAVNPVGPDGLWRTLDDGLRLQPASPCIDAGLIAGAPLTDILGNPRVGPPDIGAYESLTPKNAVSAWTRYE